MPCTVCGLYTEKADAWEGTWHCERCARATDEERRQLRYIRWVREVNEAIEREQG